MIRSTLIRTIVCVFIGLFSNQSQAAFPDDFSDVIWIDPDISTWSQTAEITADVRGSLLNITDTKASVWPQQFHSVLQNACCNRSLWVFIKYNDQWFASTFEYMRFGQVSKSAEAVNGGQIKRAPFLQTGRLWEPAEGEVYGFMTSGMARFDLNNNNVRERSNVALYRWGVGPTDNIRFTEVARGDNGRPIEGGGEDPDVEPEVCVEPDVPAPINNAHNYNGQAQGTVTVSGLINTTTAYNKRISLVVKDDRTLQLSINSQVFNDSVDPDGHFGGLHDLEADSRCDVIVNVDGVVLGRNANGTLKGTSACLGQTVTLNASFTAQSQTAPDYIDQRPLIPSPRPVCGNHSSSALVPVLGLLLEE